jgi:hypothetical protein
MATRSVSEYIQAMCPKLYKDVSMDIYVDLATDRTNASFFGTKFYNYAIALRAMHDYSIDAGRKNGEAGFITDRTEGRVSVRYLHNMDRKSKNDLLMTSYGQKLQALIRSRGPVCAIADSDLDLNTGAIADIDNTDGDYSFV